MSNRKYYLAIDIGASNGRHIIGYKDEFNNVQTIEIYRFKNRIQTSGFYETWNIQRLVSEVKKGIKIALALYPDIESMAIDTWGVDYVLMNNNQVINPVYAYRSNRTKEAIASVHRLVSFEELYSRTGIQFQPFNTIYQLYADKNAGRLEKASDFLLIPEYLTYVLTGVKVHEYTNASTTGLINVDTQNYDAKIISKLGLKPQLFKTLTKPGIVVGHFLPKIQEEVGGTIQVKLCASHDTASAVEGIPHLGDNPYLSSGTWSLLGIKTSSAVTSTDALNANFSNEAGPNYIRLQKNIMGLWIIQRLQAEMDISLPLLQANARKSNYSAIFDVNNELFLSPISMKNAIIEYFTNREYEVPQNDNDILKSAFLSLATSYSKALVELEHICERTFSKLYIVGGGAYNEYLNELTAKITKKEIVVLPIEATALGNLKVQMEELNA